MGKASFRGGVHPAEEKALSSACALEQMPDPAQLLVPVHQHLGRPAILLVKKGLWVREGELLAEAQGPVSAHVRAPRAGTISAIQQGETLTGFPGDLIVIKPGPPPEPKEGEEQVDRDPVWLEALDPWHVPAARIAERAREAGIVGQGGAAFPTAVKLAPPPDKQPRILIVNGCECEPYLTRDYRLMLEQAPALIEGTAIAARALGVGEALIGVEDNKPDAFKVLEQELARWKGPVSIRLLALKTKYPQGAEKMLIEAATGKRVPPGGLPMDVGAAIQNVGTLISLRDAVVLGKVQTDVCLTVSGRGIARPANLRLPVGTPLADVIEHCGGFLEGVTRVVVGGPMMGVAQHDLGAPVVKATSGILALTRQEVVEPEGTSCLRCARCVGACPVQLIPSRLAKLAELGRAEEAREQGIEVCMECGSCAFACPAHLPLVQWLRLGKQQVRELVRSA